MFRSLFTATIFKQRILPILLISGIIIAVLMSIGDLGKLIEKTTQKNSVLDLGEVANCNPSIAVCSTMGWFNDKKIRIAMMIGENIRASSFFPIQVFISGLSEQQIKTVSISLNLPGVSIQENKHFLQLQSKNSQKLSSKWFDKLKIPEQVKNRYDWLLIVSVVLNDRPGIKTPKKIQLAFQIIVSDR